MKKLLLLVLLSVILVNTKAGHYYIKQNATGLNNGTSWQNAYTDLRLTLLLATAGDTLFVAKGIYRPHASDSSKAFDIRDQLVVIGGFAGNESTIDEYIINNRDFILNETILSGDLGNYKHSLKR